MSKKKHPEHVNHERWLVSYADFITLLFAFFVVLFASGQTDKKKVNKMQLAMETAFEHNGIFDPHSKTPPVSEDSNASADARPAPLSLPMPVKAAEAGAAANTGKGNAADATLATQQKATAAAIEQALQRQVAHPQLSAQAISMRPTAEGLVISLREAGFFASGSADIRPQSLETLHALASALPQGPMRVEGHTDNLPIHTAQFATNWELSTARASAITRLLLADHAAEPGEISAAGWAEFHPRASNTTEAGRAENRRVDIVLLHPPADTAATPSHPAP